MKPAAGANPTASRWRASRLAWLVLWPLAGHAAGIEIPQLGVRLGDLPAAVSPPKVVDELDGYIATFSVADVHASITRLTDPAPTGVRVADSAYRARIGQLFDDHLGAKPREEFASVAGHDAWARCSAQSRPGASVYWVCVYYLIVEQHLYRLSVWAAAPQKPAQFDTVVSALYGITFEPVQPPGASGNEPAPLPRQPRFTMDLSENFYPDRARRLSEQGVVDLEFSIDGHGRARDIRESYRSAPELTEGIERLLRQMAFKVPAAWEANGSQALRFTLEGQFALASPGQSCQGLGAPARVPEAIVVTICGSRLRRP